MRFAVRSGCVPVFLIALGLAAGSAFGDPPQTTGVPGSPSATTTISGKPNIETSESVSATSVPGT
jgi:hypothetical protein